MSEPVILEGSPERGCWLSDVGTTVGIPYEPVIREGAPSNYGYFDLRSHRELIDSIPRFQGLPAARDFLMRVNGPDSAFATVACEKDVTPFPRPPYTTEMNGYLEIVFETVSMNTDKENYIRLYRRFAAYASSWLVFPAQAVNFEIHHAYFNVPKVKGWTVSLWLHGFGANREAAYQQWSSLVQKMADFLTDESRHLLAARPKE